ncbi:MAG: valine--tRNA ligase [Myxococcales bacterium]|nr:valine--tRNA ligase [Myxococcales bacterium]MCB9709470.1 valine--tRNA ligase [Myxococcales bacterium]
MPKTYDPSASEDRWYEFWEREGLFTPPQESRPGRQNYVLVIPPPNVTGHLHMGHACRATFEDVLVRYHRMRGYDCLWIPGTDHAGIATQVVVERQLRQQGLSRHDIGRDAFIERVWEWKTRAGGHILKQLRILGASCDWSRERFTMSSELSDAVREAFVRLYEDGLIYRGSRLVNWDVETQTVLSDLEVETQENVQGELFDFAYELPEAQGGGEVVVSTTRPETMLGDTALAVHPDDGRYTHLHGKLVRHPFVDRVIPIITDEVLVDPAFGTGVVKVTPGHDPNDFRAGQRHGLPIINLLNNDGTLNDNAGPFAELDRFAARKAVKAALEAKGLMRGVHPHTMTLPRSQRSGSIVEPIISTQWFLKMKPLAAPALKAVHSGKIQIIPEDWTKTYDHWLTNIEDWCISRQLWWGHQIPAYHCHTCAQVHVSREPPGVCTKCGGTSLAQDPDVLDTWFSSGLWPFSTLGWPNCTPDLARFYPTSDLETAYDILFFWVARMIMLGLYFMGDVPFRRVLLAGMVTDERGEKMSKVKGNVIDPIHVIKGIDGTALLAEAQASGASSRGLEYLKRTYPDGFSAYGADALRMTLLSYSPQTRKIPVAIKRIEGYRNFCNKLWNAARYTLMQLGDHPHPVAAQQPCESLFNRWILSRLARVITEAREGIEQYRLDEASGALYHFVWDEYCDWYLELSKPLLADPKYASETRTTLLFVMEHTLRLLHPMMPFITEELWQRFPKVDSAPLSIMLADYPHQDTGALDESAEAEVALLQQVIIAARTIRAEHDIARSTILPLTVRVTRAAHQNLFTRESSAIQALCKAALSVEMSGDTSVPAGTAFAHVQDIMILVPLLGLLDPQKERARLERELAKVVKDLNSIRGKLSNPSFTDRAPAALVERERARLADLDAAQRRLIETLDNTPRDDIS